jgi:hypothetical protein
MRRSARRRIPAVAAEPVGLAAVSPLSPVEDARVAVAPGERLRRTRRVTARSPDIALMERFASASASEGAALEAAWSRKLYAYGDVVAV